MREKINEQELIETIVKVKSIADLSRQLNLPVENGSTYRILHKEIERLNLDTSHFTGSLWSKGSNGFENSRIKTIHNANSFKKDNFVSSNSLRRIMLNGLNIAYECSICFMSSWLDKPLNLEIDHIDGCHSNNEISNLRFLCPNCHSQTETFKGKNIKNKKAISEEDLKLALETSSNIRQALIKVGLTPKGANYNRAYEICAKYSIRFK